MNRQYNRPCPSPSSFIAGRKKNQPILTHIVENIVKYIERSIKVVFLLSENSKESEWCQYELTITETIKINQSINQ
jgi:hypothetical protein